MRIRSIAVGLVVGIAACTAVGCDEETAGSGTSAATMPADKIPAGLLAVTAPEGAQSVAEIRKAEDGQDVVVEGRIAGRAEPFTDGRAQFQLVDLSLKNCSELPDSKCETPWDMCGTEQQEVLDKSLTVQVVGADGQPLKAGLKGVGGLDVLREVSIKGKVKKSPDGKAVIVNATEVYVKQG